MRFAPRCGLFLLLTSLPLIAATPVTILLDYDEPSSPAAHRALEKELASILSDSDIHIDLRLRKEVPEHSEFGGLVLFRMRGTCSMRALPIGALSDERGPLALTHASNGELLPFGEVECDRVRQCVQRSIGRGNPGAHEAQYGAALARVMAHEVYHMMAHSSVHTKEGVTKAALSSEELSGERLTLPRQAKDRLAR